MKKFFLHQLVILVLFSNSFAQKRVQSITPDKKISRYVTDQTGTLTSSQIKSLEQKLKTFEDKTSTQVVVYMISSLQGNSLEEMSYEIAEKNGIGQKGKNDGVLLFIAKDNRKLRIEVGYGLEGALPDALSGQIIRKEITPYFKQGKYYEGINSGIDAIILATKGEYKQDKKKESDGNMICGIPVLFMIILFFGFFFFILPIFSRIFGWHSSGRSSPWFYRGSGWSGSSGFSGGGFSGGGGSFGGGGASGSW